MSLVPLSAYVGLFLVFLAISFVLFTVGSFIAYAMSQAIRRHALGAKGFVREHFRQVSLFSLANASSTIIIIAWRLLGFVPKDIGGALVGPLVIIIFTFLLTTAFWIVVMVAHFALRANKKLIINP